MSTTYWVGPQIRKNLHEALRLAVSLMEAGEYDQTPIIVDPDIGRDNCELLWYSLAEAKTLLDEYDAKGEK